MLYGWRSVLLDLAFGAPGVGVEWVSCFNCMSMLHYSTLHYSIYLATTSFVGGGEGGEMKFVCA